MTNAIYQKNLYTNALTITQGKTFKDGTFSCIVKGNNENLTDLEIILACKCYTHTVKKLYRNSKYLAVVVFRPYEEIVPTYTHKNGKLTATGWGVRNYFGV